MSLTAASTVDVALFTIGWSLGWLLLWRVRILPAASGDGRVPVAVIIPARNEAHALPHLLRPLVAQRREGDRIIVVDDHSTDETARVAQSFGAEVLHPPPPPPGWLGKPNACDAGASATTAEILVFLDADVRPGPTLLDDLAAEVSSSPDVLVSMQPWHRMDGVGEQASILCNITSLMGCGAFTILGDRAGATVAFGPVIAISRTAYDAAGGHADPEVRALHTEDIALARVVGRSRLFVGTASSTTFRMYPGGTRELVAGWTRTIATGARFTPWWLKLLTAAWVWSIAGGWIAIPLTYPLIALQIWVLGRRAGTTRPLAALVFPLLVIAFAVIFARSAFSLLRGRGVTWKGRDVDPRGR
ncbi:glycosyltransferase [Ilumatobacter sp.]|uniref:glycosyltransferase n=1 Tax=Ilumatobacter sp. TaxID=1967498 RepID=UPI003C58C932